MTRTPIIRLAVHFESASEISEPPKPNIAANTNRPPRPPCGNRTPNTRSMMKMTTLSRTSTARLVTMNRKMRFINLFFGKTSHNMVTPQGHRRDGWPDFKDAPCVRLPGLGWLRPLSGRCRLCTGNFEIKI